MQRESVSIGIVTYPGCMQSAAQGLAEMFSLANDISRQNRIKTHFSVELYSIERIRLDLQTDNEEPTLLQIIIIPPDMKGTYYPNPEQALLKWILKQHAAGCIICSVCAGAFILALTGLLRNRTATIHWLLEKEFSEKYPDVQLDTNKLLINDGDLITTGGPMSWIDLGFELVAQFGNAKVMRQLGKLLVVDTGSREQRYYKFFSPKLDHGDQAILKVQHSIQLNYGKPMTVKALSGVGFLTERTFLRRFVNATGLKPVQYLQRVRIQKACDLLEATNTPVNAISSEVGYKDENAFRKVFVKIIGLTPKEFKRRFAAQNHS